MKKLLYILVALLTTLIGIFSFYISFLFIPVPVYRLREVVPIYKLKENPQSYSSNRFILQEYIVAFRDDYNKLNYYILNSQEEFPFFCGIDLNDKTSCSVRTEVNFINKVSENEVQLIEELARKNNSLWKNHFNSGEFAAKVEITGYLKDLDYSDKYTINVVDIKQISTIRFISNEEMINSR